MTGWFIDVMISLMADQQADAERAREDLAAAHPQQDGGVQRGQQRGDDAEHGGGQAEPLLPAGHRGRPAGEPLEAGLLLAAALIDSIM